MGKGRAAVKTKILQRDEKFPRRGHFRIFTPPRQQKVNGENDEIGRQNTKGAAGEEPSQINLLTARERMEELATDQVTAEHEKKIDPDPTEPVHPAGEWEAHDAGVINNDHDN